MTRRAAASESVAVNAMYTGAASKGVEWRVVRRECFRVVRWERVRVMV